MIPRNFHTALCFVLLVLAIDSGSLLAQADSRPSVEIADTAYAGTIVLQVDASDLDHRLIRAKESIPVKPGPLTLYYPQWLPGNHAPRGPIEALAGLVITAKGQRLDWTRDPVSMHTFHVSVPAGVNAVEVELQYASPQAEVQGRVVMTPEILGVQWERALVYPAGYRADRISVKASLTLPQGWMFGCALPVEKREGDTIHFAPAPLETVIDSPLFSGRYFTRVDLDPGAKIPVRLNIVADSADELPAKPEHLDAHRRLVREAFILFGSKPFDHYDFLLSISDNFTGIGLEHHRSSENGVKRGYFNKWDDMAVERSLLPHEMTHAWNGKFRRPADLWTAHYNVPMRNSLLWVYEGQTSYWDTILSARSGLWPKELALASIAVDAAILQEKRQGRAWRPMQDTNDQPIMTPRRPLSWASWQRTEDYYREGSFVWFDADTKIRELTQEKKSLDDFAAEFFKAPEGIYAVRGYTFDEVVTVLNGVAPFDWRSFLRQRLDRVGGSAPLDGLERSGWRLVFREEPSAFSKQTDTVNETIDLSYSLGVVLGKEGKLSEVVWEGPAFKAGLSTAATIVAVNGRAYKADLLKQAIREAKSGAALEILVRTLDRYRTVVIPYSGGLRYPHLELVEGKPDRLSAILRSRAK